MQHLELLAPAKNLDTGRQAINHGADAIYIGAPAFGARAAATNSIDDIENLVRYAHMYGSKVFTTVNTLLFDNELQPATNMIRNLYNIGVDAIIIQDMGLLQCDLPPIELHASTQCHNANPDRIKFLEQVGFKRIILARETSLEQMRQLHNVTSADLEAFVHGALCVSYSGQCYLSQYLNGRSGNRGECSQPCRSSYDLYTADGRELIHQRHLLSLKDFNASRQLVEMINAGITSFKIEGRLKDIAYVKNIVAYYRQLLDNILAGHEKRSNITYTFTPDPERTFNRGFTDYFLRSRQPMASIYTQKSIGKPIGKVIKVNRNNLVISGNTTFTAGDGLCFFDSDHHLQGFLVNQTEQNIVFPNEMPDIKVGTQLWRNNDHTFEKKLSGNSATRKIDITMTIESTDNGFRINLVDEDNITATATINADHTPADNPDGSTAQIVRQLSKLGDTPFSSTSIIEATHGEYFLPASMINSLRRIAVETLIENRIKHFHPQDTLRTEQGTPRSPERLDYSANIINSKAEEFYKAHGAKEIERGVEQTHDHEGKALMTTKYCLRYELGCCLQGKSKTTPKADIKSTDTLILHNNSNRFRLEFDCKNCLMKVYKM